MTETATKRACGYSPESSTSIASSLAFFLLFSAALAADFFGSGSAFFGSGALTTGFGAGACGLTFSAPGSTFLKKFEIPGCFGSGFLAEADLDGLCRDGSV